MAIGALAWRGGTYQSADAYEHEGVLLDDEFVDLADDSGGMLLLDLASFTAKVRSTVRDRQGGRASLAQPY